MESLNKNKFCIEHLEELAKYFCTTDPCNSNSRFCCGDCMVTGAHKKHDIITLKELLELYNKVISQIK